MVGESGGTGAAALPDVRETPQWRDTIYLAGFSQACTATRSRKSSLIVPGGPLVTQRLDGDALSVLHTVVSDWDV